MNYVPPSPDCPLCPRLAGFIAANRLAYPEFFNAPVPSFGALDASLLIVGLAPGLKGANRTGRPFTGDYAGLVLYSSLAKCGFAEGAYNPEKVFEALGVGQQGLGKSASIPKAQCPIPSNHSADGFRLINARITNAVRCVPPENKPEPSEIKTCNGFLKNEIAAMPNVKVILSLGGIAHKAVLMAYGLKQSAFKFGHASEHLILRSNATKDLAQSHEILRGAQDDDKITLLNSYHCSRYNINTGALTQEMFDTIMMRAKKLIER